MSCDEILEHFVQRVEETGVGKSLTLCVNGLIVVGNIISSKNYYDKMSALYDKLQIVTKDQSQIELTDKEIEHYKQFMDELKSKHTEKQTSDRYLHLDEVEIYPSDVLSTPFLGNVWRGKLSSIDGFFLGRIKVNSVSRT
jgi:hypothetical protein